MHTQREGLSKSPGESSATLLDDAFLQESLSRIIAGVSGNAVLQEDLMQQGLLQVTTGISVAPYRFLFLTSLL